MNTTANHSGEQKMNACLLLCGMILSLISSLPLQAQTCITAIPQSAPNSRYTVHDDGTVTDNQTGLMWKQCMEGLSGADCATGIALTTITWDKALQLPATLNTSGGFAGYQDWRLPNLNELESLREVSCYGPAINTTVFPGVSASHVWSSSPHAYDSIYAWNVNFYYGHSFYYSRGNRLSVRLVRGGQ